MPQLQALPAAVPANYGLVAGVTGLSLVVHHVYMVWGVMKARKKYGVEAPDLYATSEHIADEKARKEYNCVQRGHLNALENESAFLALLITAGLKHPVTASSLGAGYLVSRIAHFAAYSSGDKKKTKIPGALGSACVAGLALIALKLGVRTLQAMNSK